MVVDYWQRFSPFAAVIWAAIIQVVLVGALAARMDLRVNYLESELLVLKATHEQLARDFHGLSERIDRLDTPLAKKEEAEIRRLEEREDRIVRALDSVYNELMQHLRNHP